MAFMRFLSAIFSNINKALVSCPCRGEGGRGENRRKLETGLVTKSRLVSAESQHGHDGNRDGDRMRFTQVLHQSPRQLPHHVCLWALL